MIVVGNVDTKTEMSWSSPSHLVHRPDSSVRDFCEMDLWGSIGHYPARSRDAKEVWRCSLTCCIMTEQTMTVFCFLLLFCPQSQRRSLVTSIGSSRRNVIVEKEGSHRCEAVAVCHLRYHHEAPPGSNSHLASQISVHYIHISLWPRW